MGTIKSEPALTANSQKKKFLGIYFACCNAYGRIYNHSSTHYEGKCPRCLRSLTVKIGEGGVNKRFFVAS